MKSNSKTFMLIVALLLSVMTVSAQDSIRKFENYNASDGLADNSAQTIKCTKTGRLVITTMGQINFYDGQKFTYIDPTAENIYPLSDYKGNYHLYFDRYHHLWLKDRQSVTCVNLTTEKFVSSVEDVFRQFGVDTKVTDLFVDMNGVVWLLTPKGLYCVESKKLYKTDTRKNLQDLEVYHDQYLLLFYDDGMVDVLEQSSGSKVFQSRAYEEKDIKRYTSSSVIHTDGNGIYYQIRNGRDEAILQSFDIGLWKWEKILDVPYHLNNMTERDSILYLPSSYGYWTYSLKEKTTQHVEKLTLTNGRDLLTDVNVMEFDRQGGLWAGTEKRGLLYSRPYNSPFIVYGWDDPHAVEYSIKLDPLEKQYTFRDKRVNCVFKDSRGWTWVGTAQGLHYYRRQSDKLPQVITKRDGLMNNVIHCIAEDKAGNIWVGTSYGVSCVVFEKGKIDFINSYNQYDHLPNESFVNGRALCLDDGTIIMQQLDHVVAFNPSKMTTLDNKFDFKIYPKLTKLLVNGNEVHTGDELDGNVILEKALTRTSEINLNYDQNSISLTFSGLNYFRPQQTYYRVRVKGLDDEWRVMSNANTNGLVDRRGQLHLPLVSLRPGSYIVEVQASMTPDDWDTVPYEWIVNVNEPWWRTTGVFALLVLALLILAVINVYFYMKNTGMKAQRDNEELGLIRRIKSFADRCNKRSGDLLEPTPEDIHGFNNDPQSDLAPEFIDAMVKIIPLVESKKETQLTMRQMSDALNMELQHFYTLIIGNIYKSPRPLVRKIMLDEATDMLITTNKGIGEIADECGFVSPNYFIASFYRSHRQTPEEYRRKGIKRAH